MNKARRRILIAGGVLLLMLFFAVLGLRSGSGSELRRYKAALAAQGEKLTISELTGGNSTNRSDCLQILTNAITTLDGWPADPSQLELRPIVAPGQALVAWKSPTPRYYSYGSPHADQWTRLIESSAASEPLLREVRLALEHPPADSGPQNGLLGNRKVPFVAIRKTAQWLASAVVIELHQGRLEPALKDLEALLNLVQLNRGECTLVAQMIRVAIANLAMSATWEVLQAPNLTDSQLARLQARWESLDLLQAAEMGFVGERAGGLAAFNLWRRQRKQFHSMFGRPTPTNFKTMLEELATRYVIAPIYTLTSIDKDELFYLHAITDPIDASRALQQGKSWLELKGAANQSINQLTALTSRPGFNLRHLLTGMVLPNYARALQTCVRAETERRLTVTSVALARFKLQHGNYPQSLKELQPSYLKEIPKDVINGQTLLYRLSEKGEFLLYSVGENGKDEGGDGGPMAPGKQTTIWDGLDAVWPSPASQ